MMSRDPNDCWKPLRIKLEKFKELFDEAFRPLVWKWTEIWRSNEEQDRDFERGKSRAKGGESPHNVITPELVNGNGKTKSKEKRNSLAGDGCPFNEKGNPCWWWLEEMKGNMWTEQKKKMQEIAEQCGLDWMGDPSFEYLSWDWGHFSEPGWKCLREKIEAGEI